MLGGLSYGDSIFYNAGDYIFGYLFVIFIGYYLIWCSYLNWGDGSIILGFWEGIVSAWILAGLLYFSYGYADSSILIYCLLSSDICAVTVT